MLDFIKLICFIVIFFRVIFPLMLLALLGAGLFIAKLWNKVFPTQRPPREWNPWTAHEHKFYEPEGKVMRFNNNR